MDICFGLRHHAVHRTNRRASRYREWKSYIAESDCPDKICVHSGALYAGDSGKSLVCLPNRVAVTLSSAKPGTESEVDGIAG